MAASRGKSILGAVSIISLVSASYIIFALLPKIDINPNFYLDLIAVTISGLNLAVLFAWLAFGISGGIGLTALVIAIVLWFGLRAELYRYWFLIPTFLLTAVIGYGFFRIVERINQSYALKLEKLDEELNLLSHNIEKKKKRIKSLGEKLEGYSVLKEVAESFNTALILEDVNKLIIANVSKMLNKEGRTLLFLVDMERQELGLAASASTTQEVFKVKAKKGDLFDHWVLKYRKSLFIEDVKKDFRFPADSVDEAKKKFTSLIEVPFISENKIIGVLRMDSPKEFAYTQDDLRVLAIISDLGAVAIQNAFLYTRTQELAMRDGLTGLYLRRYFMERLQQEIKRSARKDEELGLLMLDIDHFKDYNDKYGHVAGDIVLRYLARKIGPITKEGDIFSRYGGDELALLIVNADRDKAIKGAEMIRKRLKDEPLILRKEKIIITLSIGIAVYPQDGMTETELVKFADERLYKAKTKGRDKICFD